MDETCFGTVHGTTASLYFVIRGRYGLQDGPRWAVEDMVLWQVTILVFWCRQFTCVANFPKQSALFQHSGISIAFNIAWSTISYVYKNIRPNS